MVIKNEQHRRFLLELIAAASYPGAVIELAVEVKRAVEKAEIAPEAGQE